MVMQSESKSGRKNKARKALEYLGKFGVAYTGNRILKKLGAPVGEPDVYMAWVHSQALPKNALSGQTEMSFPFSPRYSVVIDDAPQTVGGDADARSRRHAGRFGTAAARAWKKQTYGKVNVERYADSPSLKALLSRVSGDYVVFARGDCIPLPQYLYEVTNLLNGDESADVVYTDEDSTDGKRRYRPYFKPDMSPELLLNFQYMGGCFVVKRILLERIERELSRLGDEVSLWGSNWYDVALCCFEYGNRVRHIPRVLFSNGTASRDFVRSTDGRDRACIERYLLREGLRAEVIDSDVPGFYHARYELPDRPLVSIVIPNKDHVEDLEKCLASILRDNDYAEFEVIIAENNSVDAETFGFYAKMQQADARIKVVRREGEFNYSAINNFAVKSARGSLLLFLNNDTELITKDCLAELVASALRPGVAAAGAMLYYGDMTIQHGGVIVGMMGSAAHALLGLSDRDERFFPYSLCTREIGAATGACLMVRADVFSEIGGFGEEFRVALNDIDLCLKIRKAGYEILFNPYAKLYHYESKSRGYEDTPEKKARFQNEIDLFREKWKSEIERGDRYFNPNLSRYHTDFSLDL
jgi:O-antigen biosynthesis protein